MKLEDHIGYWLQSANHDLEVAESLFSSSKYDYCLFLGHLVLEKTIKAVFVKNNNGKMPPKIHNLVRLAEISGLNLKEEQRLFLDEVNEFNLDTRYPDFKFEFYKRCTKNYTNEFFTKIKDFNKWLLSRIQ